MSASTPLLQKVDSVTVPVPDLDSGLRFYSDSLGHELGNTLVLPGLSKGHYVTDDTGNVTGVQP